MNLNEFSNDCDSVEACNTQDDFVNFILTLEENFKTNKTNWANQTIDAYLSAIARSLVAKPGNRAGDPFVKNDKYIEDRREFIELTHKVTNTVGSEKYHKDIGNLYKKDSPWMIIADIFLSGKYYE